MLLLDVENTAVPRETAEALALALAGTPTSIRPVALAVAAADDNQADWLQTGVHDALAGSNGLSGPPASGGIRLAGAARSARRAGSGEHAHLLVGALAHSGPWRAVLAESEDFPHLVQALDDIVGKLGGTARRWRFDRMATVCYPSSGRSLRHSPPSPSATGSGWTSVRPAATTARE